MIRIPLRYRRERGAIVQNRFGVDVWQPFIFLPAHHIIRGLTIFDLIFIMAEFH